MTDDTTPLRTFQNILCCLGGTYVEKGGVMCAYGVLRTPCRGSPPTEGGGIVTVGTAQWPYYSLNLRYT